MKLHSLPEQRDLLKPPDSADPSLLSDSLAGGGASLALPQLRASLTDERILKAEQSFLDNWQQVLSPTAERTEFMRAWYRGLVLGYGTPVNDYFETLNIQQVNPELGNSRAPLYQVSFSGRSDHFMTLKAADGPMIIPEGLELSSRIDPRCGCCQSSIHAEMNALDPDAYPIIMYRPAPGIHMIPNRFPWDIGGVLIEPLDHDDLTARLLNLNDVTPKNHLGRTTGAIISEFYLDALFRSSDRFDLVVFQNHPLSGMSQPFHMHAHGIPAEFPKGQVIKSLAASAERPESGVSVTNSLLNITDVLLISSANTGAAVSYAAKVLENLELDRQVYTFACYNGCVAIAPEFRAQGMTKNERGARPLLHWLRPHELRGSQLSAPGLYPQPGQFNWQPYLPALTPASTRLH